MKIEVKVECQECGGTGVVSNPFYIELENFVEEHRKKNNGERPTVDEENAWLRSKGRMSWPNEEFICDVCNGAGEIQKWIDIKELAKIIKELPC